MDRAQLRPRALALAAVAALCGAFAAPAAAAPTVAEMFDPTTVVAIDLTLSPSAEAALEAEPDEYVEGTFAIAASDGTPQGIDEFSTPVPVGIRLKGGATFRGLDGKASFKVKFNEFGGSKYEGVLKRLTLNNMVQDPSMVHEVLAYEAFGAAGIAVPRTGYAYVRLNGVDYGLHLNLESLDDVALERLFGDFDDPQHLYEGGPFFDVLTDDFDKFEIDEGDDEDLSDLEALIAAAAADAPDFIERIAPVADLAEMTRFWAAERYLGHWDGYSGHNVNNYYLLSDPQGVFQMLPWGTDQTMHNWWHPFTGHGGTLFLQCLGEEACLDAYREDLEAVAASTSALDLAQRTEALAAQLGPWQAREIAESERAEHDAEAIAAGVEDTLEFLARRPGVLAAWLDPEETPTDDKQGAGPGGKVEDAPTKKLSPAPPSVSARLDLDRSQLRRGLLILRPTVRAAGALWLRAELGPPQERRRACTAGPKPVAAGATVLRCELTEAVRKRLAARALTVRLTLAHRPHGDGARYDVARLVRLPRQALG